LLVQRFHGQVPRAREELESLPGVGRKTANVVLNVAFGEPTLAVDTHVFRVANRTGLARGANPRVVEDGAAAGHSQGIHAARAPLADPARALRVHGARARLSALFDRALVRIPG
jgi:3-methyladenine DNA glycosylase/8-oxoguanine DNA glycosylase